MWNYNSMQGEQEQPPPFWIKIFFGYIYFMQGIYIALIGSTPFLFPTYPSPEVLSYFSMCTLPFSFKYISAPFVQKVTVLSYGRRKFWIIVSLFVSALLTYPLSHVITRVELYPQTVGLLLLIFLMVSAGDVCVDAAAVKELNDPVLAGYLQAGMQPAGIIIGGMLTIKVGSPTFWWWIGLDGPLCTPQTYLQIVSMVGIVIVAIAHFAYKQKVIEEEGDDVPQLRTILKYFKHFVSVRYQLCRQVIYFLLCYQGIKFFKTCFSIEAIYRGFPKERAAQIETMSIAVGITANTIFARFVAKDNIWKFIKIFYYIELVLYTAIFLYDQMHYELVFAVIVFMNIISNMRFLLHSSINNLYGRTKFAGLCLTTLGSFHNFGNNTWLQLKISAYLGYHTSVATGIAMAIIIGVLLPAGVAWIHRGEPEQQAASEHLKQA